jgi:GT2 family glycosyltransferase
MHVGIAVVHYGEQQILDDCLKSIRFHDNFDIHIQDNNENNVGYTIGNNLLIKRFLEPSEQPCDWIWLLNDDTVVPPETFDSMCKTLDSLPPEIGLVGFQIRSMDDHDFIHHAGTGDCFPSGVHKSGSVKLNQYTVRTFEKWITFASVLIRREVFERIGLLDENMQFIGSDADFCYRARSNGFKIIYEPTFVIYHKIGQSARPKEDRISRRMQADMDYFQNKWINGKLFFDLDKEVLEEWATLKLVS